MREQDLLDHLYRGNRRLPARVTIPPGDDMARLGLDAPDALVCVDQIADGVHFRFGTTPLEKIGRKAITRNVSDVAAMAATPAASLVSACLPRGMTTGQATALVDALAATAERYGCPLIGGDTAVWDGPLTLSATVVAQAAGREPIRRRGARRGDVICVTGALGGSVETVDGYTHHLDFEPRLALAHRLADLPGLDVHCMIDLSDGLAADLPRLCAADPEQPLGAVLELAALPISNAAHQAARRDGTPAWRHALADGEDYELCFTVPESQAGRYLPEQIDGVPITRVGRITERTDPPICIMGPDGATRPLDPGVHGWEHHS